jgi:C-5 cytosine-specific DNA methylase
VSLASTVSTTKLCGPYADERPLAIDLFCGLGGWTEGLLLEGYRVIGFDIEQHAYGEHRYPAQLVLQDVRTLHGRQFKDVALIVGSSPCQEFSYRAMPWERAKALGPPVLGMELFEAQFRIQREASEAAGRHIPMVVENVRGAIPWVGRSRWNFGSYHLWGDVPALMPMTLKRGQKVPGFRFDGSGKSFQTASVEGVKVGGLDWSKHGQPGYRDGPGKYFRDSAIKQGGDWFSTPGSISKTTGSKSPQRKAASAMIAKIPLPLARWIAAVNYPR